VNPAQARNKPPASNASPLNPLRSRLGTIAAGGVCLLFAQPALAVELGDIRVDSSLGEPLRASIAYALGPNEQIAEHCVYLRAGLPDAAIPAVTRATTTLTGNRIILRGDVPLREPMMSLQLMVDCPYTAHLSRHYMLLLDPPGVTERQAAAAPAPRAAEPATRQRPAVTAVSAQQRSATPRNQRPPAPASIVRGSEYRVQPGDTLSEIVSRIDNRQLNLWSSVDAIFAANPQAFANGNVDRLIAGSVLVIPENVSRSLVADATQTAAAVVEPVTETATANRAYPGASEGVAAVAAPLPAVSEPVSRPTVTPPAATVSDAVEPVASEITEAAAPEAADVRPVVSIPQTRIVQAEPQPVPVAEADVSETAQSWLVWLGGAGVAIFLGLLLFGRRIRERFDTPAELEETQINEALFDRRRSDRDKTADHDELGLDAIVAPAGGYELDGDLGDGRGFDSSDDIDVALDYGFTSSGDYGDEISAAVKHAESASAATAARKVSLSPDEPDNTGYDMSMVVDVTKQDFSGSATTRDLQAIQVEPLKSATKKPPALDLTSEFDHRILEQDYEDEFSATQIQNMQIEEAARELQERLGQIDPDPTEVSMAEDLEGTAEVTAEMPSRALHDDATEEMPARSVHDDVTAEMPARNLHDDVTAEMPSRALGDAIGEDSVEETDINNSLTARLPGGDSENDDFELDLDDATVLRHTKHG
jgi:murein DD-endopeptidase MepM/ murein hydrolase activator NlpD